MNDLNNKPIKTHLLEVLDHSNFALKKISANFSFQMLTTSLIEVPKSGILNSCLNSLNSFIV
jgi:hypothetical protein